MSSKENTNPTKQVHLMVLFPKNIWDELEKAQPTQAHKNVIKTFKKLLEILGTWDSKSGFPVLNALSSHTEDGTVVPNRLKLELDAACLAPLKVTGKKKIIGINYPVSSLSYLMTEKFY